MAKKRKPPDEGAAIPPETVTPRSKDRHKPRKMLAFTTDVYAQLQQLADRNDRPIVREARRIIIEALKREGLWPPPDQPAD